MSVLAEQVRCQGRGVRVEGHRGHDTAVTGTREECLHDPVEDDMTRQLHPGMLEWYPVRCMRHDPGSAAYPVSPDDRGRT
jgi:hypothetical protein